MLNSRNACALLSAVLLLALPACDSGSSSDDGPSIAGQWESEQAQINDEDAAVIRFDFDQNRSDVSGTGLWEYVEGEVGTEIELAVDGNYNGTELDFTATGNAPDTDDNAPQSFDCTVQNESAMTCDISEMGQTYVTDVSFTREQ